MRIQKIIPHILHHNLEQPFESSFSTFRARTHCLVEMVCDNGLIGWGECLGPATINAAIIDAMSSMVIGRNPLDIEPIWLDIYNQYRDQGQRGVIQTALSGIDIALWDIAGQHFQAPIYQLMGGAFRTSIPAYATGGFRPTGQDHAESCAKEMAGYVAEGFGAVKIKIGYGLASDLATIKAVREAIGPDIELMIDANHGYDAIDAIALGREAAQYNIAWFEEPVVPEALAAYRDVRAAQPIPVAAGETWHGRWAMDQALNQRCVDILQPDICGLGGLSEGRKIITLADTYQVRLVPHVWGTAVALAAGLHFHAILPPSPPSHESRSPLLEFDRTHNPFRQAIVETPIEHHQGRVKVPDGPGLGIEINREALQQFKMT
ncbi:mandelate racemase/muconate lactonizing enzyme family protein [Aestuariirhabdus sp. Z084]|uniref:mandelate racemase/muconate lactonizing enzyme family protein n=1 Tax=Aestuariirhabdus haliotis TaxID=2918751 RepID=UPI00201B3B1D|nr:mandelate racemase/muconate lactonizing enzyme family protein [Aestuariirhabdus haliotis]MCL6415113.1 mandelate racemase/muconate lactonizing enzyme family protein [Aestuariirhabdus haliotis]MCL6419045.1 mandelate racemase/muconate lactonizing enzyme family protein [Aestuariirhabdus haliotis]